MAMEEMKRHLLVRGFHLFEQRGGGAIHPREQILRQRRRIRRHEDLHLAAEFPASFGQLRDHAF